MELSDPAVRTRPRGRIAVALAIAVAALAAPARAQKAAAGFDHGRHVADVWLTEPEVARDCGGCHDYRTADPARRRRPEQACEACHAFDSMQFPAGSYLDLVAGDARFPHGKHLAQRDGSPIACRTCHDPGGDAVPAVMPVPLRSDTGLCSRCHGEPGFARTAIAERAKADRPFRHDVHVPPDKMGDPAECRACHTDVYSSDAENLGERQFDPARCRDCHAVDVAVADVRRPSLAAATFLHWDHLKNPAARTNAELAEKACAACHAWDPVAGTFSLGPRFAGGVYEGCISCHGDRDVSKKGGRHGELADCWLCHRVEEGGLEPDRARRAENRPRALLPRPRPASFALAAHAHPFITANGITADGARGVDQECARCHRAQVSAVPSALAGRPFDHGSHLPARFAELEASQCVTCHANLRSDSFSDLDGLAAAAARIADGEPPASHSDLGIFEPDACERCHTSGVGAVWPESPLREVMWFSHRKHLNKFHPVEGRAFTCTDCHVEREGDGFRVRVGASYRDCTECHGHRDHPQTTRGYGVELVQSCFVCHAVGVPPEGEPVPVARRTAALPAGAVDPHENPSDCAECHRVGGRGQGAEGAAAEITWAPPRDRSLEARFLGNPHSMDHVYGEVGRYFFNARVDAEHGRKYCIDCHWEWSLAGGGALDRAQDKASVQYTREPYATEDGLLVDHLELRRRFGADLEHFPGFAGDFRE